MSYDLNVIVLNQKKPSKIPFHTKFIIHNEKQKDEGRYYYRHWPVFSHTKGIQYTFLLDHGYDMNAMGICDTDFDLRPKEFVPHWVEDRYRTDITPLRINEEYWEDFEKTMKFLISCSPIKSVMFLARYQALERGVINGVLSFDQFKEMLDKDEIMFNICYIISKELTSADVVEGRFRDGILYDEI